jgi:hypothetical protein
VLSAAVSGPTRASGGKLRSPSGTGENEDAVEAFLYCPDRAEHEFGTDEVDREGRDRR